MKTVPVPETSSTQSVHISTLAPGILHPSGTFTSSTRIQLTQSVTVVLTAQGPKLRDLREGDAREADYEIAWAAYKRIEPHYSRTNRILADM